METALPEGTLGSAQSSNLVVVDDVVDEHQSPLVRARPSGRKAAKRAKKQATIEAQSALGERVVKSFEDMTNSNSVGWNKAIELHEQELRATIRNMDIQAILGKIVIEKELASLDKILLDSDPAALGSPTEKSRILRERRTKVAELRAQAYALMTIDIQSVGNSGTDAGRNLSSRFDEVTSG